MPPVAEPGTSTSEFKVLIGTVTTLIVAFIVQLFPQISQNQRNALELIVGLLVAAAASYIVSRGVRKSGTTTAVAAGLTPAAGGGKSAAEIVQAGPTG